jgi:hypothetical protein
MKKLIILIVLALSLGLRAQGQAPLFGWKWMMQMSGTLNFLFSSPEAALPVGFKKSVLIRGIREIRVQNQQQRVPTRPRL